jgi:hypothetical protein
MPNMLIIIPYYMLPTINKLCFFLLKKSLNYPCCA